MGARVISEIYKKCYNNMKAKEQGEMLTRLIRDAFDLSKSYDYDKKLIELARDLHLHDLADEMQIDFYLENDQIDKLL